MKKIQVKINGEWDTISEIACDSGLYNLIGEGHINLVQDIRLVNESDVNKKPTCVDKCQGDVNDESEECRVDNCNHHTKNYNCSFYKPEEECPHSICKDHPAYACKITLDLLKLRPKTILFKKTYTYAPNVFVWVESLDDKEPPTYQVPSWQIKNDRFVVWYNDPDGDRKIKIHYQVILENTWHCERGSVKTNPPKMVDNPHLKKVIVEGLRPIKKN